MKIVASVKRVLIGTAVAAMMSGGLVWATASFGTHPTLVGPPALFDPFKIKRSTETWEVEIEAKNGLKVATQSILFDPGAYSGWHVHPGPVFLSVKEGNVTEYDYNCNPTLHTEGEGFAETGLNPHFVKNESPDKSATVVVTYLLPPSATALRADAPAPPCSAF